MNGSRLVVISTHPIQYHAPVYREVERLGLPVTAIYGTDFSVAGYHDREFDVAFAWSTDLLSGYSSVFLSRVTNGGARTAEATSVRGLFRVLSQIVPDAVLLTGYSPAYLRSAAVRLYFERHRILFRAETADHARDRSGLKNLARDFALRRLYQRCAALLYIGERSRAHFERLGAYADQLYFSPYCVDASVFEYDDESRRRLRTAARQELEVADDQTVLIFSGKLVHRKGPDLLVEAVSGMPRELRSRFVLLWLGDGELRESLVARSNDVSMRFVGFKNQDQLSQFYHAGDALVLPSRSGETWGLVVNEALLHGLPCVVSDRVGCGPDLIEAGRTGEIFQSDSATALRNAFQRLLLWHRVAGYTREACRQRVAGYSVNVAARGVIAAFEATVAPIRGVADSWR